MKYLMKIFYPLIWAIRLPRTIRNLRLTIDRLSEQLEHYESSTDKDFEKIGDAIEKLNNKLKTD